MITVQPGDTLWGIAREIAPGEDPREVIAEIERLNSSVGAVIQAGDELVVPVDH
jgi:LysM repeat protein